MVGLVFDILAALVATTASLVFLVPWMLGVSYLGGLVPCIKVFGVGQTLDWNFRIGMLLLIVGVTSLLT